MHSVISPGAQYALDDMSDILSAPAASQAPPMPSPNVANKAAPTKKTPEKKGNADLSQKLAKRKSQDFKSKIAAWDSQGQHEVVVVEEGDEEEPLAVEGDEEVVVEVEGEGEEEVKAERALVVPKTPTSGKKVPTKVAVDVKTSREIDAGRKAWVRRRSKPAVESKSPAENGIKAENKSKQEVTPDVKKSVAPKKRVVSDGHWRRDRPPKTASPEKEEKKDEPPKPRTVRRSVMGGVGLKFPPSVQNFVEDPDPEPVRRRHLRAPSRSRSRSREHERAETPDYESGGTKVYIKRRRRSKDAAGKAFSTSESSLTAGSSFDRPSTATDITTPEDTPTKAAAPRPRSEPREKVSRKSPEHEAATRKSPKDASRTEEAPRKASRTKAKDDHEMPKPLKIGNAGKSTPKIPGSAPKPPNTLPRVFSNRIDGWLSGINDDPFTEASERSLTPEPLEIRRKKSRPSKEAEQDYDVNRRDDTPKRRQSRPSLEKDQTHARPATASGHRTAIDDWVHDVSPETPTLRRRGAKRDQHSPIKDRTERGSSRQLDDDSMLSDVPRRPSRRRAATSMYDQGSRQLPSRPRAPSIVSEQPTIMEGSVLSRASDSNSPARNGGTIKRRLTKHSDLMSVLSLERDDSHRIKPSRSRRSRRDPSGAAIIGDLMNEVSADELKYQRELRTLVDGVIPVLLTYVLNKNDAKRAPGSRKSSAHDNPELTKPIVDMGVALERLKTQHKRIPMHDPNELLLWAQSSAKVYVDYLAAWRLGFSDVVVNLAPAEDPAAKKQGSPRWDHDLQRNENGDMVNSEGERVDVAYLLKRPLVRLKALSKAFKGIFRSKPSKLAEDVSAEFDDLVIQAKQRTNDERARLEDESAAAIDPTRARDPHSLAPLSGVNIDPTRSVRARDYFDMQLYHSSGQQLSCKVELVVRDDVPNRGSSGDILFCEVSMNERWLLLPPVVANKVSACAGDREGEMVVMIRGMLSDGSEWREIMSLQSNDEQTQEWLEMIASDPKPPRLIRNSSFNTSRGPSAGHRRPPSPTESEFPIGERAARGAQRWDGSEVNSSVGEIPPSKPPPRARYHGHRSSPLTNELSSIADSEFSMDDRLRFNDRPRNGHARSKSEWAATTDRSSKNDYSVWMPSTDGQSSDDSDGGDRSPPRQERPGMHRRTSSVPSMDLPTIRKQRRSTPPDTPRATPKAAEDPSSAPPKFEKRRETPKKEETPEKRKGSSFGLKGVSMPSFTPAFMKKDRRSSSPLKHEYEPSTTTESSSDSEYSDIDEVDSATSESEAEENDEGVSTVGDLRDFGKFGTVRRPSRPQSKAGVSQAGESLDPSDSASQGPYRGVPRQPGVSSAKSVANILAWTDEAGWQNMHPQECEIVVTPGMIEAFDLAQAAAVAPNSGDVNEPSPSTRGVKALVALELTPLVPLRRGTAIDISIRSPPTSHSLIRTGANIMFRSRSPEECEKLYQLINRARIDNPTWIALENARGPVQTSNWAETMDRRNAARTSGANGGFLKSLSRKSGSYRSKGNRSASIAASQSSVNSMGSAFSALHRFSGGGSKIFDIAKSTITSRKDGSGRNSTRTGSDSLSSGAATPTVPFDPRMGTPIGVTNTKIRLYYRENASKWQDMGAARLTILLPPRPTSAHNNAAADPRTVGLEKRILVHGKSRGETLLDATLGESCFERIARTGIAVSIWEDAEFAPQTGGVAGARSRVYMLQCGTEREAAYTFSMVGKMRY